MPLCHCVFHNVCAYIYYNILHTDVISSLKLGDSGGSVDTSLSPNNLSNSTLSVVPVDRRLRDEEPDIFSRLPPGQFGPKGNSHSK